MAINFPNNPTTNQTFTVGVKTWIWNGYAWDLQVANTVGVTAFAQQAFNTANSASSNTVYTQGVDASQNTRLSIVEANTIYLSGALNQTNTDIVSSNTQLKSYTDGVISSSNTQLKSYVDGQITNTLNYSNGIDAAQNTRLSTVESNTVYLFGALNQTNTNIVDANTQLKSYTDGAISSSVSAANTQLKSYTDGALSLKFDSSGGNITGPVTISANLTVTGNLTVAGNVTTVSANNLILKDNMIYLNDGSTVSNPDLGIAGNYNDGIYRHAGFFRDASDGYWKVYDQYLPEPDASPYIDTSNSSFRIADFQANNVSLGKISTSSAELISNLNADYLDGQHGSYYSPLTFTQEAYNKANTDVTSITTTEKTYGNTSSIPVIALSANGRVSSVTNTTINIDASFLTSGTISTVRLGSGTANANTYLAGDNTWKTISAGSTSTPLSVRQVFTATAGQTSFTVTGGYTPYIIDVYRNGIKLVNGTDVIVSSGNEVVLSVGATSGDAIEVVGFTSIYSFGIITADNLVGTIPSQVLANSTHYIGTTAISLNRASAPQSLTGITSIDGSSPAGFLSGSVLSSNVTSSSLTSVGTLTSLSVSGTTGISTTDTTNGYSAQRPLQIINGTNWIGVQANTGAGSYNSITSSGDSAIWFSNGNTSVPNSLVIAPWADYGFGIRLNSVANTVSITGAVTSTNAITAYYSDENLKTRLGNIENAVEKVLSLNGFYYQANETAQALGYKVKKEVGLSAQEVQRVMPEIVVPAPIDEKYLTIHYERLVPLLVEAIKEQQTQIDHLKVEIDAIKREIKVK